MEIVFRAAVVFVFLWGITRVTGKATLGELSTFQLLLYVVMGDLIQQGVTQQDVSLTGAMLAISVFALFTVTLSWMNFRWPATRRVVHGSPAIVVRDGEMLSEAMHSERLSTDDFYEAAREQGIRRVGDIELAILEPDGRISFFQRRESSEDTQARDRPPAGA